MDTNTRFGTSAPTSRPATLSKAAQEQLQMLYRRCRLPQIVLLAWERLLTPPERKQLGGTVDRARVDYIGAPEMLAKVRGWSLPQAVIEVALAVNLCSLADAQWLSRELRQVEGLPDAGEDSERDLGQEVQQALRTCLLVLVEKPGKKWLYWRGERISTNWSHRQVSWDFLRGLAEQTRRGNVLDTTAAGLPSDKFTTLTMRLANLKRAQLVPADLIKEIETLPKAYRFKLKPQQVQVFNLDADDWGLEGLPE